MKCKVLDCYHYDEYYQNNCKHPNIDGPEDSEECLKAHRDAVEKLHCDDGIENRWYKVGEVNYPPINDRGLISKDVLVQCENGYMFVARLDGSYADITWIDDDGQPIADVVAWHPLPSPAVF